MDKTCDEAVERYDNDSNVKLISLEFGSNGLGIRLSKSSWDPYPFISHVDDDSTAQERGLQVGDCILKVCEELFRSRHTCQSHMLGEENVEQELGN